MSSPGLDGANLLLSIKQEKTDHITTLEVDSIPDTSQQELFITAPVTPTKTNNAINCCYRTCLEVAAFKVAKSKSSKRAYCSKHAQQQVTEVLEPIQP